MKVLGPETGVEITPQQIPTMQEQYLEVQDT